MTRPKQASFILWTLISLFAVSAPLFAARYTIDPDHSSVEFKIRHMMVNRVRGQFDKFSGDFNYEPGKPESWSAAASIEAKSINTGNEKRDNHLRSADFFEVEKYPTITFKSTGIKDATQDSAKLTGLLNMHGVEKPVTLDLKLGGVAQDPWGNQRAGFEATGKINRKDFGIIWNKVLGNGGVLVGEDVDITIQIEGVMEKAQEKAAPAKKK